MADAFPEAAEPPRIVTVLLVSPEERDHRYFGSVFARTNWRLRRAYTIEEALELLERESVGVIVAEQRLAGGGWQTMLRAVEALACPPKIVLWAISAEPELASELLEQGGWDVLARPFHAREILECVSAAWLSWKAARERCAARAASCAFGDNGQGGAWSSSSGSSPRSTSSR